MFDLTLDTFQFCVINGCLRCIQRLEAGSDVPVPCSNVQWLDLGWSRRFLHCCSPRMLTILLTTMTRMLLKDCLGYQRFKILLAFTGPKYVLWYIFCAVHDLLDLRCVESMCSVPCVDLQLLVRKQGRFSQVIFILIFKASVPPKTIRCRIIHTLFFIRHEVALVFVSDRSFFIRLWSLLCFKCIFSIAELALVSHSVWVSCIKVRTVELPRFKCL